MRRGWSRLGLGIAMAWAVRGLAGAPGPLRVEVLQAGAGVQGAEVHVRRGSEERTCLTSASGTCAFPGLGSGSWSVLAWSGDALAATRAEAGGAPVRLNLEPGRAWTGRVLDSAGRPIAQARLEVTAGEGAFRDFHFSALTGADGRFRGPALPAGPATLWASAPGYLASTPRALTPELELRLEAEAPLAGVALLADGGPLAQGEVEATDAAGQRFTTGLDLRGRFAFHGMRAGPYTLRVHPGDWAEPAGRVEAPKTGVQLRLAVGGSVRGRVQRAGAPVALARIQLVRLDGQGPVGKPAASDAQGAFELRAVPDGRYRAESGDAGADVEVRDGQAPFVELRLP